jgi:hypothetical protein
MELLKDPSEAELDVLVCGYSNEKLAELYSTASLHPGTDWHVRLSAEVRRRGLQVEEGPQWV